MNSRVREHLRHQGFAVGARLPAERELATALGVGRTVLRPILEALEREGVLERRPQAGTFLASVPTPHARGAKVVLIAPFGDTHQSGRETEPMWLHRVASAFERVARPAGVQLELKDQSPRAADPCSIKHMVREAAAAGARSVVLVHPLGHSCHVSCALTLIHDLGAQPLIASGRNYPGMASSVYFDSSWGFYCATRHLLEQGHQRIGFAGAAQGYESGQGRVAGYLQALEAAEIDEAWRWVWEGECADRLPLPQDGVDALEKWLALPLGQRPTAIVAINDVVAIGLLQEARARGISIPGDLSLIGFDNDPAALMAQLTTLERPTEALGEALARVTLERLAQEQEATAVTHRLRPTLIERGTVGPPPAAKA